ncbi:MAG: M3 family peptidase, partial [Flavobacteriaceae bacterium]|nr:M3 family peptidase [Flavobacteriaceae bacterium]
MSNPLLEKFHTKHTCAPFSLIKEKHFKPAFKKAIDQAKAEIDNITSTQEAPSFENTIEALEFSGQTLDRVSSIFFNLNSAETNDEIQKIAQEVSPWLSQFSNDIRLNEKLFERVKAVFENRTELDLTTEQQTLLEKKYKGFARNGANLNALDKEKLREIDKKLSQLTLKFGENVLAETNAYELHITDQNQLKGLPDSAKEA